MARYLVKHRDNFTNRPNYSDELRSKFRDDASIQWVVGALSAGDKEAGE
jgi:hypothetical protein